MIDVAIQMLKQAETKKQIAMILDKFITNKNDLLLARDSLVPYSFAYEVLSDRIEYDYKNHDSEMGIIDELYKTLNLSESNFVQLLGYVALPAKMSPRTERLLSLIEFVAKTKAGVNLLKKWARKELR